MSCTAAYVPGAQGGMLKISSKFSMSEKQCRCCIDATVHMASEKDQKAIFKRLQILPYQVPKVIPHFKLQKVANQLFFVQGNCLQISTRLAQKLHHKLSTKCVTNLPQNWYVIMFSCLIRAEFLFDNIASIFESIYYIKMLQIVFFVQSNRHKF
jgi:hypothetical protein